MAIYKEKPVFRMWDSEFNALNMNFIGFIKSERQKSPDFYVRLTFNFIYTGFVWWLKRKISKFEFWFNVQCATPKHFMDAIEIEAQIYS